MTTVDFAAVFEQFAAELFFAVVVAAVPVELVAL